MDTFPDSFDIEQRFPRRPFKTSLEEKYGPIPTPYKPKDWKPYFDSSEDVQLEQGTFRVYRAGTIGPYVLLLHGCGMSALSFALFANEVKKFCRIIAPDFRGHGHSVSKDDLDMSRETLSKDTKDIVHALLGEDKETPLVVLGHSMGGAIAAAYCHLEDTYKLSGSAMNSLSSMNLVIQRRPKRFESIEDVIQWSVNSNLIQNTESACVSMPDQVVQQKDAYVWKVNLKKTEPYWEGWYKGMDNLFLTAPGYKLLALARRDTLDTPMTIAHMQGKYQMLVFNGLGHNLHEDSPTEMAHVLQRYLFRYQLIDKNVEDSLMGNKPFSPSMFPL